MKPWVGFLTDEPSTLWFLQIVVLQLVAWDPLGNFSMLCVSCARLSCYFAVVGEESGLGFLHVAGMLQNG